MRLLYQMKSVNDFREVVGAYCDKQKAQIHYVGKTHSTRRCSSCYT
jgi:hypothetical protein